MNRSGRDAILLTTPRDTQIIHQSGSLFIIELIGKPGHGLHALEIWKVLGWNAIQYRHDQVARVTQSQCGVIAQPDNGIGYAVAVGPMAPGT
jgi:hypothetical protein